MKGIPFINIRKQTLSNTFTHDNEFIHRMVQCIAEKWMLRTRNIIFVSKFIFTISTGLTEVTKKICNATVLTLATHKPQTSDSDDTLLGNWYNFNWFSFSLKNHLTRGWLRKWKKLLMYSNSWRDYLLQAGEKWYLSIKNSSARTSAFVRWPLFFLNWKRIVTLVVFSFPL